MKNYKSFLLVTVIILFMNSVNGQTVNWANLNEENRHIITAKFGIEYGVIYEIGYGYQIKTNLFPIVANVDFSFPSGNFSFDDFKIKIGGQIRLIEYHNFQLSTKIQGVFRRYGNDFVRLLNFGSDMSAVVGYYNQNWFAAVQVGFDKAIVTHFKHSSAYKDQFAGVVDGWYQPPTGGNFYYGLQAGYSLVNHDFYLIAGKILTQDFKTKPILPLYGQLGYNLKF